MAAAVQSQAPPGARRRSALRGERWFSILTERRIKRGSHHGVDQLESAVREFLDAHNKQPKAFRRTKTADEILARVALTAGKPLAIHRESIKSRTSVTPRYRRDRLRALSHLRRRLGAGRRCRRDSRDRPRVRDRRGTDACIVRSSDQRIGVGVRLRPDARRRREDSFRRPRSRWRPRRRRSRALAGRGGVRQRSRASAPRHRAPKLASAIPVAGGVLDATGFADAASFLPASFATLAGLEIDLQSIVDAAAGPRLTNARRVVILNW
jgi:hypothetical protein